MAFPPAHRQVDIVPAALGDLSGVYGVAAMAFHDIRVNFADKITDANRLGVTTHQYDPDGWIVSADITVATHDTAGTALAQPLIAAIARHEVGHALGLAHSKDRSTIMYPESQTLTITGPDRATLKLLYTLPPGSVK